MQTKTDSKSDALGFLKNLTGFSMATWIGFIISFVTIPITTRLFRPDQAGVINMFIMVSSLFTMLVNMGLDMAYARFFHEGIDNKKPQYLLAVILVMITIATIIISALSIGLFSPLIANLISGEDQKLLPWLLFINVLSGHFLKMLNLNNRMRNRILSYTIQSILMICTSKVLYLVAALWNPHYLNAIILIVSGTTVLAIVYCFVQRREFLSQEPLLERRFVKQLLVFGLPYMPTAVLVWLNSTLSSLVLRHVMGDQGFYAVGIYNNAVSIATILGLIQVGFNQYWVSYVFANYKTEQSKIKRVHSYLTFVMILFSLLIVLSQDLIYLLIGKDYAGSQVFFPFLLIYPCCLTISETTGLGIGISKKTYLAMVPAVVNLAVNTAICYVAIPMIGTLGAAIASAASGVVMFVVKTVIGERYYKCVTSYWKTAAAITIAVLAAVINYVYFQDVALKYLFFVALIAAMLVMYHKDARYLTGVVMTAIHKVIRRKAAR